MLGKNNIVLIHAVPDICQRDLDMSEANRKIRPDCWATAGRDRQVGDVPAGTTEPQDLWNGHSGARPNVLVRVK